MINLDNVSFIEDSRGKKAVIISVEAYNEMQEQLEDIHAYVKVKGEDQESFPISVIERVSTRRVKN